MVFVVTYSNVIKPIISILIECMFITIGYDFA